MLGFFFFLQRFDDYTVPRNASEAESARVQITNELSALLREVSTMLFKQTLIYIQAAPSSLLPLLTLLKETDSSCQGYRSQCQQFKGTV